MSVRRTTLSLHPEVVQAWVGQNVLECNVFKTIFLLPLASPIDSAMLAAEATPWLQPRYHRVAMASDHAMTLRIKAGRALDAQETSVDHNSDGRPSNAD